MHPPTPSSRLHPPKSLPPRRSHVPRSVSEPNSRNIPGTFSEQAFVTAPADLLKTRMMADGHGFRGPWHCAVQTVRHEGALALWKGMLASYLRLGPHFLLTFPLYERIRASFGLGYL